MALTVEQYIAAQKKKINDLQRFYKPFERSVRNVMALQSKRIFTDGINSHGSLIGHGAYNDNKPLYVNPNTSPGKKFKPAGKPFEFKNSKGKIKSVRDTRAGIKTRWFSSYKEYRQTIGRRVDVVNLFLSGDLFKDFSNAATPQNAKPIKVSNVEYLVMLKRPLNVKKKGGIEDKYGEVFRLTRQEKEKFFETLEFNFKKALIDG